MLTDPFNSSYVNAALNQQIDAPSVPVQTKKISKKINFKPFFISKAIETLEQLSKIVDKDRKMFKRTNKSAITPGHVPRKPRAKFIGVSKNGTNWQSLIVINNNKVYMGTMKSQVEAATIFDFYSMITHYKSAKVNFDYSARQLETMIKMFRENDDDFVASWYLSQYPQPSDE